MDLAHSLYAYYEWYLNGRIYLLIGQVLSVSLLGMELNLASFAVVHSSRRRLGCIIRSVEYFVELFFHLTCFLLLTSIFSFVLRFKFVQFI